MINIWSRLRQTEGLYVTKTDSSILKKSLVTKAAHKIRRPESILDKILHPFALQSWFHFLPPMCGKLLH